jgi:hypothetical protein
MSAERVSALRQRRIKPGEGNPQDITRAFLNLFGNAFW